MDTLTLPPELDRFAEQAVADGRFPDKAAVVAAGLELLQRQEVARAEFTASLEQAAAESDEVGWFELDDILGDIDRIIEGTERKRA